MKVGINGLGRIGRLALRAAMGAAERQSDDPRAGNRLEVVHLNELKGGVLATAHLLEFDSVQGRWRADIQVENEHAIRINDKELSFSSHATAAEIPWGDLGVEVVLECTGKFLTPETLQGHLDRGAKRVIVAAPVKVGNVLNVVCDLTVAADNARFGQTGPQVGSFDGGYGSGLLARIVGQKRSREVWYTCNQYGAEQAYDWGLVNEVVPIEDLEIATCDLAAKILTMSPLALRMLKASHNAVDDGLAGIQQLAGDSTMLFYMTEEAQEGRDAFKEKRQPNFGRFPKRP